MIPALGDTGLLGLPWIPTPSCPSSCAHRPSPLGVKVGCGLAAPPLAFFPGL